MPLYIAHHPWPRGTMSRDEVLDMIAGCTAGWQERGIRWLSYWGTTDNGEGWCLIESPSREALLRVFDENRIPYLIVTQVWHITEEEADARSLGAGSSRIV